MEAMQCYRLQTIPCDTADMTRNTIPTLFPIRMGSHFVPLHSPNSSDSPDSLIFFSLVSESARRKRWGIYPERLGQEMVQISSPNGAVQGSPGQRPGNRTQSEKALKGRSKS